MSPDEIMAFSRGYHVGVAAGQRKANAVLLAEARALELEVAQIRAEVARFVGKGGAPDGPRLVHRALCSRLSAPRFI